MTYVNPTPRELKAREAALSCLRRVVHGRFSNARVSVFGSCATGLSLPDRCVPPSPPLWRIVTSLLKPYSFVQRYRRSRHTPVHQNRQKGRLVQALAEYQTRQLCLRRRVRQPPRAHAHYHTQNAGTVRCVRLPLPSCFPSLIFIPRYNPKEFKMDIGINNPLGVQAIGLVSAHLKSMPALRPLVLVAKGFLRQRGLNDAAKGGLGSFALVCLCIHFLQVYPPLVLSRSCQFHFSSPHRRTQAAVPSRS